MFAVRCYWAVRLGTVGVVIFPELQKDRFAEYGKVVWLAARDYSLVDTDLLINPVASGIPNVGL